jgi:hypothetical protein
MAMMNNPRAIPFLKLLCVIQMMRAEPLQNRRCKRQMPQVSLKIIQFARYLQERYHVEFSQVTKPKMKNRTPMMNMG